MTTYRHPSITPVLRIQHSRTQPVTVTKCRSNRYGFNIPYIFEIHCLSRQRLHSTPNLGTLSWHSHGQATTYTGFFSDMIYRGQQSHQHAYCFTLKSSLYLLAGRKHNRTFTHQTKQSILQTIFSDLPSPPRLAMRSDNHPPPLIIQYHQNDFAFLWALLSRWKMRFLDRTAPNEAAIWFMDNQHLLHTAPISVSFVPQSGTVRPNQTAFDLQFTQTSDHQTLYLRTDHSDLFPGQRLHIAAHPIISQDNTYRITHIQHVFDRTHQDMIYQNFCTAYPIQQTLPLPSFQSAQHTVVTAKIHQRAESHTPPLNALGQYDIKFDFDHAQNIVHAVPRLQPYGGKNINKPYGIHLPLPPRTAVAVGFHAGDLSQPVILGAFSTEKTPTVTTHQNPTQYRFHTVGGQVLLFDDQPAHPRIYLQTKDQQQTLQLDAHPSQPVITLQCQNGPINITAHKNIEIISGKNQHIQAQNNVSICAQKNHHIFIQQGNFTAYATKNLCIKAQQNIRFQTLKNDIVLHSMQRMTQEANILAVKAPTIKLAAQNSMTLNLGNCELHASHTIQFNQAVQIDDNGIHFAQVLMNAPIILKQ